MRYIAEANKKVAHEIVNHLNPKLREELQKEVGCGIKIQKK